MKRESVGIKEVDEMIQGGFPRESIVGVSGPPGVGKSIFAMHFLLEGAKKGQKGVYICLEEPRSNVDRRIKNFSFSKQFYKYEKEGLIVVRCFDYLEYSKINLDLLEKIKEDQKVERVVIDSFNCFFDYLGESKDNEDSTMRVRKLINLSFSKLRRDNLTTLLVLESFDGAENRLNYGISYLIDGVIKLDYLDLGVIERRIFVPKMRWTNQCKESKGYDIGSEGIFFSDSL